MKSDVENVAYYSGVRVRQPLRRLTRFIGGRRHEVTCLVDEVPACTAWLERGDIESALPCGEYRERPWNKDYRWTRRADISHREGVEARESRTA